MQKGTHGHSRVRRVLICLLFFGGVSICTRLAALDGGPVWLRARGGAREPGGWYRNMGGVTDGRCIAFVTSYSQPFMLDNCHHSFASLGYRSERHAFRFDWSLLHHPLYREDTVSLVVGVGILDGNWIVTIRPELRRMAVRGFPNSIVYSCGYACSFVRGPFIQIGIEGYTVRDCYPDSGPVDGAISARAGVLRVVINKSLGNDRAHGGAIGVELDAGNGLTVLSGYNTGTDEISAGFICRVGRYVVGAGWSEHEALGTTISFGVGRVWSR